MNTNLMRTATGPTAFALTLALLVLAGACGGPQTPEARSRADEALRTGDFAKAAELYQAAVEKDPKDAVAHGRLGQILARQGDVDGALAELDEAIRLEPSRPLPYIEKCRILLNAGRTSEAETEAQRLSELDDENGPILQAFVLRKTDRVDEAVTLLEGRVAAEEESAALRINLAMNLLELDRAADAETHLKYVLENIDPSSSAARIGLIESYRAQGRLEDLVTEYEELVAEHPEDDAAKLALALVLLDAKRFDDAMKLAETVVEKNPDSGWAHYVVGVCHIASGDASGGVRHLEIAQRHLPGEAIVQERLAMAKGATPAPVAVAQAQTDTGSAPTDSSEAAEDDWRSLWKQARYASLLQQREAILQSGDADAANVLVMAALFSNNLGLANELLNSTPEDSPVRPYLAAFNGLTGQLEAEQAREGLQALRNALDSWNDENDTLVHLKLLGEGFALASVRLRSEAFSVYHRCMQEFPENGVPLRNLAAMYAAAGMPEFAGSALRRLINLQGNVPELRGLLYNTYTQGGLDREAVSFAESTYATEPTAPEPIATLARLYLRTGEIAAAIRVLEAAAQDLPDEQPLKVLYAGALVRAGKPAEAIAQLDAASIPDDLLTTASEVRAFASADAGEWSKVVQDLRAQDMNELTLGSRILLAAALAHEGDREGAIATLPSEDAQGRPLDQLKNSLTRVLGGDAEVDLEAEADMVAILANTPAEAAQYVYAIACRSSQLYSKAYHILRELHLKHPDDPQLLAHTLDMLSRADTIEDRSTAAEEITKDKPDSADAWAGLARVYGADGDTNAEGVALERAVELAPDRADFLRLQAAYANRTNDKAIALEAYRRLLDIEPENPTVLNNYAYYILENNGSPAEAERHGRAAMEKIPGNPNITHTVGLALLRQGKLDEAEPLLERALRMRPGDPTLSLDYGRLLIQRGQRASGVNYVRLALAFAQSLGLDFPRAEEATAIIAQTNAQPDSPPA